MRAPLNWHRNRHSFHSISFWIIPFKSQFRWHFRMNHSFASAESLEFRVKFYGVVVVCVCVARVVRIFDFKAIKLNVFTTQRECHGVAHNRFYCLNLLKFLVMCLFALFRKPQLTLNEKSLCVVVCAD